MLYMRLWRRQTAKQPGSLLPVVRSVHTTEEAVVAELERDPEYGEGLFPILWFAFVMTVRDAQQRREHDGFKEQGAFRYTLKVGDAPCPSVSGCRCHPAASVAG